MVSSKFELFDEPLFPLLLLLLLLSSVMFEFNGFDNSAVEVFSSLLTFVWCVVLLIYKCNRKNNKILIYIYYKIK